MTKQPPKGRVGVASESEAGAPEQFGMITVSRELRDAGEAAFDEFFGSYPTSLLVEAVYRAMHSLGASDRQVVSESRQRDSVSAHETRA
jgi:hypothetical protein